MLTINAKLEGHRLTITGTPQLAADSARVDRVKFDFDDEWTGFSRVALFWGSDGEEPYAVAVDGQGYAVIPWETIQEKGRMRFGVYGIKGTSRITSTVLKYQIQDGAWSASPANPGEITPTMLEQLQALVETAVEQMDDRLAEFDAAVETFFPHRGGVGALVTVEGTVDASPAGLTIYGRSVQDGTPAPDAPADIVTAGENGSIEMHSTNGSLFDPAFLLGASDWSVNGNVYSGDAYALWQRFNSTHWISDVPSGTRLTISGRASIPSAVSYPRFVFNYADGTSSNVNLTASSEFAIFSGTSEVGKDVDYITFTYSGSTSAVISLTDMRISIGATDGRRDYIAPVISAIPTPNGLPGIPVSSGGNYTDTDEQDWLCDTIDLEAGTWTKRCGIVSYDGQSASGWERVNAANSKYRFRNTTLTSEIMKAANNDTVVPLLCTHYTATSANATWTNSNVDGIAVDNGGGMFVADAALCDAGTLEQFLARFQTTHMTIIYPLATPVVTQLTEAQIAALRALRGRKGLTNLYSADPAGPEFRAEMYIDIPTYIAGLMG